MTINQPAFENLSETGDFFVYFLLCGFKLNDKVKGGGKIILKNCRNFTSFQGS